MSTEYHSLHEQHKGETPDGKGMRIGIAVAEWNHNITGALLHGAIDTLTQCGVAPQDIAVASTPGSFELIYAAAQLARTGRYDAVIIIGCVVRGDTPHFDYICSGVTQGIAQLNATQEVPVIFGLITTNDMQQAEERSGGRLGNKGSECALTALEMIKFRRSL